MKYLIIFLAVLFVTPLYATEDEKAEAPPFCPTTKISDNNKCMVCHALVKTEEGVRFGLKEIDPYVKYADKPSTMDIVPDGDGVAAFIKITGTGSLKLEDALYYLPRHPEIKKLILELQTPGGSVMDAWRTIGIIKMIQGQGIIVETRTYGLAASAGVILMVAGDIGHRYVNPHCEVMIHKVWTFAMFDFKTPDTAEDQANTLKHFQANINKFILSRSKLTDQKLQECIFKKDFWLTGEDAVKFGLADHLVE